MRSWARRTAMATLVAVAFAAAGGGLSGPAFAGTGGDGNPGALGLLGPGLSAPASTVCDDAGSLLGIAVAGCRGGAVASADRPRALSVGVSRRSVSSGTRTRGVGQDHPGASSASTVLQGAAMSGPLPGPASPALRQTFSDTLNAPGLGAGNTDNPADLPSLSGLTNVSAPSDATIGSTFMPAGALSAAGAPGMSSDSFAVLAIGALLAGAAALKIASRRARDRKARIGATI